MAAGRLAGLQLALSVLALAAVAWWFAGQEMPPLPDPAAAAAPLAGGLVLYALVTLLRGERWHRLLQRGTRADAYALTTVGYMGNNALPARAGDVLKAMLSAQRAAAARSEALGSLLAERLLDAVALSAIFAVLVLAAGLPVTLPGGVLVAVAAVLLAAGLALLVVAPRARGVVARLLAPSRCLLGGRGCLLLALSVALWTVEGAVYALLGEAVGLRLTLADGLYVMALANVAAMVPAAPGYVGTYDAAVLLGVRLVAAGTAAAALSYVVVVRFVLFVPITLTGLALLVARYGGWSAARGALRSRTAA